MRSSRFLAVVFFVAIAGLPSARASANDGPTPVTGDDYGSLNRENLTVPTSQGDIYVTMTRPRAGDTKVPVILTVTPYGTLGRSLPSTWVRRGYAIVVADVLGTGNSGGCWDYGGLREQQSTRELVEWLGTRAWSNGRVGMIGGSYNGTTANMAAASGGVPHLATIVPQVAISDWYSYSYGDGVRYAASDPGQNQGLVIDEQGLDTPLTFDFGFAILPPAPGGAPDGLERRLLDRACPDASKVLHTMKAYQPSPDKDAFWAERDYLSRASDVAVPVLVQGGWRDWNVKRSESVRWFDALKVPKMLVMDDIAHGVAGGGTNFEVLLHAWFDHYLWGYNTNIESQPSVVSVTNDKVVHRDASWPPPGTQNSVINLFEQNRIGDPTIINTGATTESSALNSLSLGGSPDAVWFTSGPLVSDVRISGAPTLSVTASTAGTSTHLTPVMFDLGPSTDPTPRCNFASTVSACTISRGFLDVRHRDSLQAGSDITPLQPWNATVRFIDTDYVLKAGHRLGVALMNSNTWWAIPDAQRTRTTFESASLTLPVSGNLAFEQPFN